jgi:hypothetical protein
MHIITTMRSRMEYVQEADSNGKISIRKVGMAPIQRPGVEYEWDIVADMDWSHILSVSKSRCSAIADMKVEKPNGSFMRPIMDWLNAGVAPVIPIPVITLEDLVGKYGAQAVMDVSAGNLPVTQSELVGVAQKLAGAQ